MGHSADVGKNEAAWTTMAMHRRNLLCSEADLRRVRACRQETLHVSGSAIEILGIPAVIAPRIEKSP